MKMELKWNMNVDKMEAQQHHPTVPVIDSNDKIVPTGGGLREINNIWCVFGGIVCENKFYYHCKWYIWGLFNENLYETILHHLVCDFEYFVYSFNHLKMIYLFLVFLIDNSEFLMDIGLFWMYRMDNLLVFKTFDCWI